jgi:hypothetical protein
MFAFEQSVTGRMPILLSVDAGKARQIPVAGRNRWMARFGQSQSAACPASILYMEFEKETSQ